MSDRPLSDRPLSDRPLSDRPLSDRPSPRASVGPAVRDDKVSVILPCYNEAGHICDLVRRVLQHIPAGAGGEVIVVDDNSPDGTHAALLRDFAGDARVRPVLRTTDRGLARAIRAGLEHASGTRIVVMDADFTHDPDELPRLLHVAQVCDLAVGSRFCAGGAMQDRRHHASSRLFTAFLRRVMGTQVRDNLGGYFVIRADKLRRLPLDAVFSGYGDYFMRLLHFAERAQWSIIEVPAYYHLRRSGASKSRRLHMLWSYTRSALHLRWRPPAKGQRPVEEARPGSVRTG